MLEVIKETCAKIVHVNRALRLSLFIFVCEADFSVFCNDPDAFAHQNSDPCPVIADRAESFDNDSVSRRCERLYPVEWNVEADVSHRKDFVFNDTEVDASGYPARKKVPANAFKESKISRFFIVAFGNAQRRVDRASFFLGGSQLVTGKHKEE